MTTDLIKKLKERLFIEFNKRDRSGIYAVTSRELAYNSNKIEGSTLTENQTASLFDTGLLPINDNVYRAKDIEEMNQLDEKEAEEIVVKKFLPYLTEVILEEMDKVKIYRTDKIEFDLNKVNGKWEITSEN